MIEKTVIQYLSGALGAPVRAELPEDYTGGAMVLVERLGGGHENRLASATIAVQSYGDSLLDAATLSGQAVRAMEEIITLDEVASCRLNSEYNYTDERSKRYRYQAVLDLTYYEDSPGEAG